MALWLVRAGRHGEHEKRFLDESRIYLTWQHLNCDLSEFTKPALREKLTEIYPTFSKSKISNNLGQIWGFSGPEFNSNLLRLTHDQSIG